MKKQIFVLTFLLTCSFYHCQKALNATSETISNNKTTGFSLYNPYAKINNIENIIFPSIPVIIKSYISDETKLLKYRNELFEGLSIFELNPWGIGKSYNSNLKKMTYENDAKELYNSSTGRNEIFKYGLKVYENLSKSYPVSAKKLLLYKLKKGDEFLKNYSSNRSKYLSIVKKENDLNEKDRKLYDDYSQNKITYEEYNSQSPKNIPSFRREVGFENAFLFRRIEYDKVPISELKSYNNSLAKLLKTQLSSNQNLYDCLKKLTLNNEITIFDGFDATPTINLKSISSGKIIKLKCKYMYLSIKCIVSENTNFYLVKYTNQNNKYVTELYDNKLNKMER